MIPATIDTNRRRTDGTEAPTTEPSGAWRWAGLVAGVTGVAATLLLNASTPTEETTAKGVEAVYNSLEGTTANRIGASLGFVAVWALVVWAAGFTRDLARRTDGTSDLPTIARIALTAAAGALIIGFGTKAAAAGGMPGGIDEAFYTHTDSVVIATLAGQLQWVGWHGVALVMAALTVAGWRKQVAEQPKWLTIVGTILTAFVAGFTLVLCLPYSAGIAAPVFLTLLALSGLRRSAR